MAKIKTNYICSECGYETGRWLGKCPSCGSYNTINEESTQRLKPSSAGYFAAAETLDQIKTLSDERVKTNIEELDRVLGGGLVQGSLTLIGGDPGIGKSTLILQICQSLGDKGKKILYVSGEESSQQIKMRAQRLGITTNKLLLLCETNLDIALNAAVDIKPDVLVIDSVQTMFTEEVSSAPGSVTQVRECCSKLMRLGKGNNISVFIIGHVTKDGSLAGPRVLEHMVDTVLYFEGERMASYRILRAVKNRFGSTNEIGVFEMLENGLKQIKNPSEYMLSGRPIGAAGSVATCSIEGTRPILTEVQALVNYTTFNMPRRMATGMDFNRVILLIAVLEKIAGFQLGSYDSYVNLAGGIKIGEPALDLAVVSAIVSSYKKIPIDAETLIFGEVGLTGEVRAVSMAEKRVLEALKLGFKTMIIPKDNMRQIKAGKDVKLLGIKSLSELLNIIL